MIDDLPECQSDGLPQPRILALPFDVRQSVLGAVAQELGVQQRRRRLENGIGLAATVLLATGIAANVLLAGSIDDRLKRFSGPSPHERRVRAFVDSVESVAGDEGARALEAWLLASRPSASRIAPIDRNRADNNPAKRNRAELPRFEDIEPSVQPGKAG